jgi:hypothetical protein
MEAHKGVHSCWLLVEELEREIEMGLKAEAERDIHCHSLFVSGHENFDYIYMPRTENVEIWLIWKGKID